jgi:hypothetical protein
MSALPITPRHAAAVVHAALVLSFLIAGAPTADAQGPASAGFGPATPVPAQVSSLAWIAGQWKGTLNDRVIEQHWMTPLGPSMVGMYRNVRDDQPQLYELLAIEQDGEGVALRIKHFAPGAGLTGRQEKDQSMDHALVRLGNREAVFIGGAAASPARITFSRPDHDTLLIVVERMRDGAPAATEFRYTRVDTPRS